MVLFFWMKIRILPIKNFTRMHFRGSKFPKISGGASPQTPPDAHGLWPLVIMTVGALVTNFARSTPVYKYLYFKYLF